MLIILFLLAALNLSSSAPLTAPNASPGSFALCGDLSGPELSESYRTKRDIIWSCLATIFACTWVAVHPNLPGPWDSEWVKMKRRVVIMIYALLAPEFIAIWALRQWIAAGDIARQFNEKNGRTSSERSSKGLRKTMKDRIETWFRGPHRNDHNPVAWSRTHGFFVQMGGFMLSRDRTPVRVLELKDLLEGIMSKAIDAPDCTENDIGDKSKGDFFTKSIVVLQTTWFVFQCIARWASHLPVTELEVITLAFAVLNVITYALWWKKPQNVLVAVRLQLKKDLDGGLDSRSGLDDESYNGPSEKKEGLPRENGEKESWISQRIKQAIKLGWFGWVLEVPFFFIAGLLAPLLKITGFKKPAHELLRVPMFSTSHTDNRSILLPLTAIGSLFGSIHLIPWSFSFPSTIELWLWRASATVITVEPIAVFLAVLAQDLHDKHDSLSWLLLVPSGLPAALGAPLYIVARLVLLVLGFTTLKQLPPDAYKNIEWISFLPHV